MRKFIFAIIILIQFSCQQNKCNHNVLKKESIKIAHTAIKFTHDSLKLDLPFSTRLKKIDIITDFWKTQEEAKLNPPKVVKLSPNRNGNGEVIIEKLVNAKVNGEIFFNKTDSLNFVNQNCVEDFSLSKEQFKNVKFVKIDKIPKLNDLEYIEMSFPIFSSNNKKAYMEINIYSKKNKFGISVYLEKIGNKWLIIDAHGLWDV